MPERGADGKSSDGKLSAAAIIAAYRQVLTAGVAVSVETFAPVAPTTTPVADDTRPCVLILAPHPDDECLTGALPLRLARECGWRVVNLAVTLGSDKGRRAARLQELSSACGTLGFDVVLPREHGLDAVMPATRQQEPELWHGMIRRVGAVIAALRPALIVMPHADDGHPAHSGTHALGLDALVAADPAFTCQIALSEYWQALPSPNLMIGIGDDDAARLLTALACHTGENARNPFDIRFPAWLIDNVRRGSERVGGVGAHAAALDFAMLYCMGLWRAGRFIPSALNRIVAPGQSVGALFEV